jgi:hypothetical protein
MMVVVVVCDDDGDGPGYSRCHHEYSSAEATTQDRADRPGRAWGMWRAGYRVRAATGQGQRANDSV